jgi:hypothetical protein
VNCSDEKRMCVHLRQLPLMPHKFFCRSCKKVVEMRPWPPAQLEDCAEPVFEDLVSYIYEKIK